MNKITSSEANRNFTAMTKRVDEEKVIAITKNGKEEYIIMKAEEYMKLRSKDVSTKIVDSESLNEALEGDVPFWMQSEGAIIFIDPRDSQVSITTMDLSEGYVGAYSIDNLPRENISIDEAEWDLIINIYQRPLEGGTVTQEAGNFQTAAQRPTERSAPALEHVAGIYKLYQDIDDQDFKACKIKYIWDVPKRK